MAQCSECGVEVHVFDGCDWEADDKCWACLDTEVKNIRKNNEKFSKLVDFLRLKAPKEIWDECTKLLSPE